jgi:ribosomal protein S18 acetylase RimI-like enzyme
MSSSLPEGFRLREGGAGDVKSVTELIAAEEEALRGSSQWTEAETRDWFHAAAGNGDVQIVERDKRPVGVLGLFFGPVTRSWISVDPSQSDDRVCSALVELAEQLARENNAAKVQISVIAENRAIIGLLQNAGFRAARRYFTMQIELNDPLPTPQWPDGITCTTFELAEARGFYDATVDAFAEEVDFHPLPFDEWKRRQFEAPEFDPSLWFVARDGNEIAGLARCWPQRWGCGWIDVLGVRKQWRRRGLGLALLQRAFRAFYERGHTCVGLAVDSENRSGAGRLYERAGMRLVAEDIAFAKELA